MIKTDTRITAEGMKEMLELHSLITQYLALIKDGLEHESPEVLTKATTRGEAITHMVREIRGKHLQRVADGKVGAMQSLVYTDMLNGYRRIKDHSLNIAEAIAGEK
jgi:phosphate:Na+ symporter